MIQKLRGNSKGFTLIELMIVIAIIGILAAIAIPNFIAYRDKAYCSKVESDAQNVLAALASYFSEPENTSITGGVSTLEDEEELVLNGENLGTLTEIGGVGGGIFEAQISDGSGRCPRAEDGALNYYTYMGSTETGGWK